MDVPLRRLDRATFRMRGASRGTPADTPVPRPPWGLAGVVIRGLLVGAAIGILLVAGSFGVASVVAIGVLALGAALLSWDR
jgi:hypothetical protein